MKRCRTCGKTKPLSDFPLTTPHRITGARWERNTCRVCTNKRQLELKKIREAKARFRRSQEKRLLGTSPNPASTG